MKVILLQDIEKLGRKYDIKEVKDGYARNYLIPKSLVKLANKKTINWAMNKKEIEIKKAEEELKKIQEIASAVDGQEIIIPVRVGEDNQLFESITQQKIFDKLKEAGFNIKKNQINLEEPIKQLGEFPIKINFKHNLESEIRVIIAEEK